MQTLAETPESDVRQYCSGLNSAIVGSALPFVKAITAQHPPKNPQIIVPTRAVVDLARTWTLPWSDYFNECWRNDPRRFGIALMDGSDLCGLALGRFDHTGTILNVFMIEGNPSPDHAFKGYVLDVVDFLVGAAAIQAGASEVRIIDPNPGARSLYVKVGYPLLPGSPGYCVKRV
jgi:hypothetical protein